MNESTTDAAVLLLHGFGGEPFEMEPIAERLAARGVTVSLPLLPGHGTTIEDFSRSNFSQWCEASDNAYSELAARCARVYVVGLSMGGVLSLRLAALRNPAGCVALAAPMYLYRWYPLEFSDWRLPFVPLLRRVRPLWPTGKPKAESRRIAPWKGYEGATPLNTLRSLMRGMAEVKSMLPDITCPLRVAHALGDKTVPVSNAFHIMERVSSQDRQLTVLSIEEQVTGHHVITTHEETRERVAALVEGFVL